MYPFILMLCLLLCGCTLSSTAPSTPTQIQPSDTPIITDDNLWLTLAPGLEQRIYFPTPDNEITKLAVLRIDPNLYTFRVHYHPGAPLTIRQWAAELPDAVAFINANFFDQNGEALGLLVADATAYGSPYTDRGSMFALQNNLPLIRSNIDEPYLGETLEQAVQGFPMLVRNGTQSYNNTAEDTFTRRTVIAQDNSGNILFIVTPLIGLPLLDLSAYLPTTDMNLFNAVNLDGGGSTLMYLNHSGEPEYIVTSLDPVPAVLAVYPK